MEKRAKTLGDVVKEIAEVQSKMSDMVVSFEDLAFTIETGEEKRPLIKVSVSGSMKLDFTYTD